MLTFFDKAIAGVLMPAITTAVLNAVSMFGISGTMTVKDAIVSLLTGLVVYLVPNKN